MTDNMGDGMPPVRQGGRVIVLDAVRGFAIFGILLVNVQLFSGPEPWLVGTGERVFSGADLVLQFLVGFLVETKFYSIFSFLFGLGLVLQTARAEQRAEQRGRSSGWLLVRRLAVLAVFGLIHAVFVWSGDILLTYALLGFVFLPFRRCRPRTMIVWAGVLLALPALLTLLIGVLLYVVVALGPDGAGLAAGPAAGMDFTRQLAESAQQAYGSGSYTDMVVQRLRELGVFYSNLPLIGSGILAMFLLGGAVVRAGWLEDPNAHRRGIRRAARIGLLVGLPLNLFAAYALYLAPGGSASQPLALIGTGVQLAAGPVLASGYIGLAVLLFARYPETGLVRRTSAVGKMALTNYLAQSVVMTSIFYAGSPGLYGQTSLAFALLLGLILYAFQLLWSPLWLSRFSYGPAEWLWRRLTYGRLGKHATEPKD